MTRARDNADGARLDAPLANPTFTGSFTFTPTSSIPASPTEGMMYYESDEDTIMVYGGTNDGAAAMKVASGDWTYIAKSEWKEKVRDSKLK